MSSQSIFKVNKDTLCLDLNNDIFKLKEQIMYTIEQLEAIKSVRTELETAIVEGDKMKAYEISQRLTALYASLSVDTVIAALRKAA